jgi:hypothetical protein
MWRWLQVALHLERALVEEDEATPPETHRQSDYNLGIRSNRTCLKSQALI